MRHDSPPGVPAGSGVSAERECAVLLRGDRRYPRGTARPRIDRRAGEGQCNKKWLRDSRIVHPFVDKIRNRVAGSRHSAAAISWL